MLDTPFTPWPDFTQEEADAVSRVLLSNRVNYWTGRECREFEKEFAAWTGCEHAVALANGTVALDIALHVLGIGPGDEVVVAPRTFIASVSCVVNAGARPVFADVDRESQNITAESIHAVLTPRTRAVICVHLAGMPCDMDPIMALASEKGLRVIEDCAQAHGARYKGRSVGTLGDLGAWSFCQDKIITTGGEGGMLTTNRRDWWEEAWSFKDHGKSWDAVYRRQHPPGFRWLHESFGTNWRLTEMQAAIGRIQLKRMPEWQAARTRNAEAIRATARTLPALRVPALPKDFIHAWYKCYVFVRPERLKTGLEPGSHPGGDQPEGRALLFRDLPRGVPGESIRECRFPSPGAPGYSEGVGGNEPDVTGSPVVEPGRNREDLPGLDRGPGVGLGMIRDPELE